MSCIWYADELNGQFAKAISTALPSSPSADGGCRSLVGYVMHVSYLTEIFDAFLSLHSSEEHHPDSFSFESLGGKKIIRKSVPQEGLWDLSLHILLMLC